MNVLKKCANCQQPAGLMCSRCLEVYCCVECQIRDWAEHKKICIVLPKLYPNDSYLDVLGAGLPPRVGGSTMLMLQNNSRSLKPLRKPNFPIGAVELSLNRNVTRQRIEDTSNKQLEGCSSEEGSMPGAQLANGENESPVKKTTREAVQNITIVATATSECEKRFSKMKIEEVSKSNGNETPENGSCRISNGEDGQLPQSLAKLKREIIKNHELNTQKLNDGDTNGSVEKLPAATFQNKPWLLHFPLEKKAKGEPMEVIVEYIDPEKPKHAWVIQVQHEAECDKLLRDIHGQLDPENSPPLTFGALEVGDIYAGPYEGIYYRVVVREKSSTGATAGMVKVRLIDYGNEILLAAKDLRAPLLLMKNLRAFAFEVQIQNLTRPLELLEHLQVCLLDESAHDEGISSCKMVELVQPKPNPNLVVHLEQAKELAGKGGIVSVLSSRRALVMLSAGCVRPLLHALFKQMPEEATNFPSIPANNPQEQPQVGDMLCFECPTFGWSRGLVIERFEQNYLVYTVDSGSVELIQDGTPPVRKLPEEYRRKPWLVVQLEVRKVLVDEQEFKRVCYHPSFAFGYERQDYDAERETMSALMKDSDGQAALAEVELGQFVCDLAKVGVTYWPQVPQDKSIVRITAVVDVSTVIICPQSKINLYTDLLQAMLPSLKPLGKLPAADEIIVSVDDLMMPYRARVLQIIKQNGVAELELLDLDNGCIKRLEEKAIGSKLFEANAFIRNLPVFTMKAQIRDMNVALIKDPEVVLEQLNAFMRDKHSLRLMLSSEGGGGSSYMYGGVKLIDVSTNRSVTQLVMEKHAEKLREEAEQEAARLKAEAEREAQLLLQQQQKAAQEHEQRLQQQQQKIAVIMPSPTVAAANISTSSTTRKLLIDDLTVAELPADRSEPVKLMILDDSDVTQGLLTVCELTEQNSQRYATLTDDVNKVATAKKLADSKPYEPETNEICLAIFDADKLWYRAVCLQPHPATKEFIVQFIDYGNVVGKRSDTIRPLPTELEFPCVAHTCQVKEIDKALPILATQQQTLGHILSKKITKRPEGYELQF